MKLWKNKRQSSSPLQTEQSNSGQTLSPTAPEHVQRWLRWNQETQTLYQRVNALDPQTQALVLDEMLVDEVTTTKEATPLILAKTRLCKELLHTQLTIACCILLKPITEWCLRKNLEYPPIVEEVILQCIQIDAARP